MACTAKCIVCLREARFFTCHVRRGRREKVTAGFCYKHHNTICPHLLNTKGCFGIYTIKFGVRKV